MNHLAIIYMHIYTNGGSEWLSYSFHTIHDHSCCLPLPLSSPLSKTHLYVSMVGEWYAFLIAFDGSCMKQAFAV